MTNNMYVANGHNQNNNHWILVLLILLFFLCLIMLSGCSVEFQDKKALSRVLANSELIDAADAQFQKNHPPRIDTQKVYIKGETIYVPVIKTIADLQAIKKAIDSTKAAIKIPKCDSAIEIAYQQGYDDALKNHPPTQEVDTAKYTTIDARALNSANDTINKLRLAIAGSNGQLKDQHDIIEKQAKEISQLNWRFYGSWGGLLFIIIGFFAIRIASKNNTATATANAGSNILTTILNKIKGK